MLVSGWWEEEEREEEEEEEREEEEVEEREDEDEDEECAGGDLGLCRWWSERRGLLWVRSEERPEESGVSQRRLDESWGGGVGFLP